MSIRTFEKAPATFPLMVKAALPALPVIGGLPGIKHSSAGVPALQLQRTGVTIDPEHLAAYNEVCGFPTSDAVPTTYPHMSAFALHMALMTDTSFPFAPMGLVHLRNTIRQHRPITVGETFDVSVKAADLRPHPKGQLIDLLTEISIDGNVVWDEVTTLFARGKKGAGKETSSAPLAGVEVPNGVVQWKLDGNLGRRYGAVSGDRNPIHLYPITAKAFGFSSNIAHGMWSLARSLASVQNRIPDAHHVDVEFKKPILLPARVTFGHRGSVDDDGLVFGIKGVRKPVPHLVGRITPA